MIRRRFLGWLAAPSLWGWRIHVLVRHDCAGGGTLYLTLRGEPWKLTARERELIDWIGKRMKELEPEVMQGKANS